MATASAPGQTTPLDPPPETTAWQRVGGAPFGQRAAPDGPTTHEVDLFASRFRHRNQGMIGGAACRDRVDPADYAEDAEFVAALRECERVPVIYEFDEGEWTESYRSEEPGYVAAIAWIDFQTALAVGGTGTFPRREHGRRADPPESYEEWVDRDPAGEPRAWLYRAGDWRELETLPEEMTALSALDVWQGRDAAGREYGVAGGLGQLWEWRGGRFTGRVIDRDSAASGPETERAFPSDGDDFERAVAAAAGFHFRVREVRFAPERRQITIFAVTGGCCGLDQDLNGSNDEGGSRLIAFDPAPLHVSSNNDPDAGNPNDPNVPMGKFTDKPHWRVYRNDPDGIYSFGIRPQQYVNCCNWPDEPETGTLRWKFGTALTSPSSPEPGEGQVGVPEPEFRYVAGDGDIEVRGQNEWIGGNPPPPGDGDPDWKVGIWNPTSLETPNPLGRRGLLARTPTSFGQSFGTQQDEEQLAPAYPLNAVEMLDGDGTGFAVGDRGAVLKLETPVVEPPGANLPRLPATPLADRSPFDDKRPSTAGDVAEVPPLAARPRLDLERPVLVPAGTPDWRNQSDPARKPIQDADQIIMSRDGSEGWALGPSLEAGRSAPLTLYHYRGGAWTQCDPVGIPGLVKPDPACEDLAPFYSAKKSDGTADRVQFRAAARIPVERDADPTNDDEFEVLAVGSMHAERVGQNPMLTLFRYRDGRWRPEDREARLSLQLAVDPTFNPNFTFSNGYLLPAPSELVAAAPNDLWLLGSTSTNRTPVLVRFDGERWINCLAPANAAACDDPQGLLTGVNGLAQFSVFGETMAEAGGRIYLGGARGRGTLQGTGTNPPVILGKDPGGPWTSSYDLGAENPDTAPAGRVHSISVARSPEGGFEGWAVADLTQGLSTAFTPAVSATAPPALLRLELGSEEWEPFQAKDAAYDYVSVAGGLSLSAAKRANAARQVTLPAAGGESSRAYFALRDATVDGLSDGRVLEYDPDRKRWGIVESGEWFGYDGATSQRRIQALGPADDGGIWIAGSTGSETGLFGGQSSTHFYRYSKHPPAPVLTEAANPVEKPRGLGAGLIGEGIEIGASEPGITDLAGAPDGAVWMGTETGHLYRYDRLTGWERLHIPGWSPGRLGGVGVSPVNALAVGPDGGGIAVGDGGIIARFNSSAVTLDPASSRSCAALGLASGCGTTESLRAAAVAADGSGAAIAGGANRALVWRPSAGEEFRAIARPPARLDAAITGLALTSPGRAWASTNNGDVFIGELSGGRWRWRAEAVDAKRDPLSLDAKDRALPVRDLAVDAAGHGFAVGDAGLVLERTGDGGLPWRRVNPHLTVDLSSVALPTGSGAGALVGGWGGLVLTLAGSELQVARHATPDRPPTGPVTGLALLPGLHGGQAEAWAAVGEGVDGRPGSSQLLHYSSDPDEPLLDPGANAAPLPDVPAPRQGEISLAAFGRSDCLLLSQETDAACLEFYNSGLLHEVIARRVRDEIRDRASRPGGPELALFTGDPYESALATGQRATEDAVGEKTERIVGIARVAGLGDVSAFFSPSVRYRRFNEQILDPLTDSGLPTYGAIGARDVSETRVCSPPVVAFICLASNRERGRVGENHAWRQTMLDKPSPWGRGTPPDSEEAGFEPANSPPGPENIEIDLINTSGVPDPRIGTGGARSYYAFDLIKGGERVLRVAAIDTSAGSLAASDTMAHPTPPQGQALWLEGVLCYQGQPSPSLDSKPCSREPDQRALVLSTTPTYSYGPGAITDTQTDGAALEQILFRYDVDAVVSGRLGWNGLYWMTAPGLHEPCPGGEYPAAAPRSAAPDCAGVLPDNPSGGLIRPIPFAVSSTAGGRFGPDGNSDGDASEGFWRGYSIVRLPADRDTRKTVVEQRPILDWVRMSASNGSTRRIPARAKFQLVGEGREPIGVLGGGGVNAARFDRIDSAAITHRYDLLLADPERPWLAKADDGSDSEQANGASARVGEGDPCGQYVCLDPAIGRVDDQTGRVRAGNGNYPRTFAIAMLSIGERAATYPLIFEPAASYRPRPPLPPPPLTVPPAFKPPTPASPTAPAVDVPPPPAIPHTDLSLPTAPLTPPAPPAYGQGGPIGLELTPAVLLAPPPTVVLQPPNPLVQPAPPSGARREARQRQAASQKSGADGAQEGSEAQELGGDTAEAPHGPGYASTRQEHGFTAIARQDPVSAWARDAMIGGGLGVAALVLALSGARPTPRRRPPEQPAPAWARSRPPA